MLACSVGTGNRAPGAHDQMACKKLALLVTYLPYLNYAVLASTVTVPWKPGSAPTMTTDQDPEPRRAQSGLGLNRPCVGEAPGLCSGLGLTRPRV